MNSKSRITVRMPRKLNVTIDRESKELGISKNALILQILWKAVEEKEKTR